MAPTTETKGIVKIPYEGETVDAEELGFSLSGNNRIVVTVADGTRIEIIPEVKTVYKLCEKRKADGSPIYITMGLTTIRQVPAGNEGKS